jgi:hypothetical protein
MTDENVNNNTEPQDPPAPEPEPQVTNDDDFSGKQHMAAEINRLRKELEEKDAAQKAAQEAAERKKLEEQGKFKELAERAQKERDELQASYAAKERSLKLEAAFAGIENEHLRAGVIARCDPDANIAEYAAQVRKDHADYWGGGEALPRISAQGQGSSGATKQSLKEKLAAGDQDTMKSVFAKVLSGEDVTID